MRKVLLISMVFYSLIACKKKGEVNPPATNPTGNILSARSHIVDTTTITGIMDNYIILSKTNTQFRPNIGDILIGNPTVDNPDGFLRKVISITDGPSQVTCNTEATSLKEAFDQLTIDQTFLDTISSGIVLRTGPTFSVKFQDNNTIAPGCKLNGELILNIPSIQIQYISVKGSIDPERILLKAEFNTDGSSLEISKTDNTSTQPIEKTIAEFKWKVFVLIPVPVPPLGIVVVRVPFANKIALKLSPSMSAKLKWTTLPKISATLGAKYENGDWSSLSTFSIDASAMPLSRLDFTPNVSITAGVKLTPEYSITPYAVDALKAFFSVPNSLDLTIQPFTTPNYSLKYKLDISGGVKQDFYTGIKQEYSLTVNAITKTILEGNWVKTVPNVITGSISSVTQTTAISGGDITDDGGDLISARGVCWNTSHNPTINDSKTNDGTGNGSYLSNITGLTTNTTYYVRAYATNSIGTAYGNEMSFRPGGIQTIRYKIISWKRNYHDSNGNISDGTATEGTAQLTLFPGNDSCTLYIPGPGPYYYLLNGKYSGNQVTIENMINFDGHFHPLSSVVTFSLLDQTVACIFHISYSPDSNITYFEDDPLEMVRQ